MMNGGFLGAGGEAGVTRALQIINKEMDVTMALMGERDVKNVGLHNIYSNDLLKRQGPMEIGTAVSIRKSNCSDTRSLMWVKSFQRGSDVATSFAQPSRLSGGRVPATQPS